MREPGVGQDRNQLARIKAQEAHCIVHLFRASGAVEADDVHVERFEGGEGGADLSTEQHGAGGFKRDLHRDWQALTGFRHGIEDADQHGFRLQQILTGFGEQNVHAAFD